MNDRLDRLRRAEVLLVVSALCFGALPIFGKLAYLAGVNVQTLLGLRFTIAGVLLALVATAGRRGMPRGRALATLVAMGVIGYVGQSSAYFNSLLYVPAAVTSILLYTYPAIVALLSVPLFGTRLTRLRVAALVLALAGCALVAGPSGHLRWEGVVLGLLAAVIYSGYILSGKRVMEQVDAISAVAVVSCSAGVTYMAFTLGTGSLALPQDNRGWVAILGLALVATMIAAVLFLAGLRHTDPGRASLISTLEPVSTAILAGVFFGETLSVVQLAGGALVLAAVVLVSRVPS
ncbi:MAG: hypothetical protein QOE92_1422 [Chloroflexota bacterium]|jgi:drug/metabolite transporter (DMT)-like permease|nr:hypothetical protein [Chloroflexota bacterium]